MLGKKESKIPPLELQVVTLKLQTVTLKLKTVPMKLQAVTLSLTQGHYKFYIHLPQIPEQPHLIHTAKSFHSGFIF
ncbi:MAG: hypothetical protein II397_10880, partial [Treponema sp.]|nr:hypothetical protein [Treponema sp.]